jgi:glycerol-3-phosphate acyltransferase PlsY
MISEMSNFVIFIIAYCIGSIPVGRLVARAQGIDIEKIGSGNVGATNVARSLGKKAGLFTLFGDIAKGVLTTLLGFWFFQEPFGSAISGMLSVFGHCLSIPGVSKGGKGVASSIGVIAVLSPLLATIAIGVFIGSFIGSRIVSASSIAAALSIILAVLAFPSAEPFRWPLVAIALLVIARHHQNISRLLEGKEQQFSLKKSPPKEPSSL